MAADYEALGLMVHYSDGIVRGADGELRLPWRVRSGTPLETVAVLILQPGRTGEVRGRDFALDNGLENVVAVGPGPTHEWTVEPVGSSTPDDGDYHRTLTVLDGRLITHRYGGGYHEFDPATGEHRHAWEETEFRLGGRILSFPDPVR